MNRVRTASLLILFGAWLLFTLPFVAVGPDDVRRVAEAYLVEDARTVGSYDPIPPTNGAHEA